MRPKAWNRYVAGMKTRSSQIDPKLARFAARYQMASGLTSVEFNDLSAATSCAYTAALRCALAYSALETLDAALSNSPKSRVMSASVSRAFASPRTVKLHELLTRELHDKRLVARIDALALGDETENVTALAVGVRQAVFHGGFTAHGSGAAQSKAIVSLLNNLAAAVLETSDSTFELFLDHEAIGPWEIERHESCPTCDAKVGTRHDRECEISRCRNHGDRVVECYGYGRCQPCIYWGVYPGTIEALKRGWIFDHHLWGPIPDLNRVHLDLKWDPTSEMWVSE